MRESWREFSEQAETWLLDVIFQQRPGKKAAAVRFVLLLLSRVFGCKEACSIMPMRQRANEEQVRTK